MKTQIPEKTITVFSYVFARVWYSYIQITHPGGLTDGLTPLSNKDYPVRERLSCFERRARKSLSGYEIEFKTVSY